jgi:hypothetical protein
MKRWLFVLALMAWNTVTHAQTIQGRVVDAKTNEPMPFANVFINNSTVGTTTELDGTFVLKNVRQPAVYEIIFSFVGYESYKLKVSLTQDELKIGTIRLKASEEILSTIEVKGTRDTQWEKKLKRFRKIFLGDDDGAALCEIKNSWALEFDESDGKFVAKASQPLDIENKYLGYKQTFFLKSFSADATSYLIEGNVRFDELPSDNDDERMKWAAHRAKSYGHSRQHLFRSIVDRQIRGGGFDLFTEINPLVSTTTRAAFFNPEIGSTMKWYDTTALARTTNQAGVFEISIPQRMEVHYKREKIPIHLYRDIFNPVSWITLRKGTVLVNRDGVELNPAEVTVAGDMNNDRVAHLLPIDYIPMDAELREQKEALLPFLEEKFYIHTDKPYYYPGENIWFKGYVNYREPAMRDSLSRTVYVELVNAKKKEIIFTRTLKVEEGRFQGDIFLPLDFDPQDYTLRAYTQLSRNFGDAQVYRKAIPVLNLKERVTPPEHMPADEGDSSLIITTGKPIYQPRERIEINIQSWLGAVAQAGNYSVSVTDATQVVPREVNPSILTAFPLAPPDGRGDKKIPFTVEHGLTLQGQFLNGRNKAQKALLYIMRVNPQNLIISESDEKGKFVIRGLDYYDTAKFAIQGIDDKGKMFGRAVLGDRSIPSVNLELEPVALPRQTLENIQRLASPYELPPNSKMLNEVVIKGEKIEEPSKMRSYGKPDYVVKAKDLNFSYGNLLQTLPGKFPGLIVRQMDAAGADGTNGAGPVWVVYVMRAMTSSALYPKEVLVMINDVAVGGRPADILGSMNPSMVESIELKTSISVLNGSLGGSGLLNIRTKTSELNAPPDEAKVVPLSIAGYYRPREFKYPNYGRPAPEHSESDFRSLIYWNPSVSTLEGESTTISFYAADVNTRYRITVEGVSAQGKPVRAVHYITITK